MDLSSNSEPEQTGPVAAPSNLIGRTDLWSAECIDFLKILHANRYTNSQMAQKLNDEFGTSFARNAVIGKCSRLGLKGNQHVPDSPEPLARAHTPRPTPRTARRRHPYRRLLKAVEQPIKIEPEIVCEPVSLLDLQEHHCRWPVTPDSASQIKFCGARKADPHSYCGCHCRMAFHANYQVSEKELARRHFMARRSLNSRQQNLQAFFTE